MVQLPNLIVLKPNTLLMLYINAGTYHVEENCADFLPLRGHSLGKKGLVLNLDVLTFVERSAL